MLPSSGFSVAYYQIKQPKTPHIRPQTVGGTTGNTVKIHFGLAILYTVLKQGSERSESSQGSKRSQGSPGAKSVSDFTVLWSSQQIMMSMLLKTTPF